MIHSMFFTLNVPRQLSFSVHVRINHSIFYILWEGGLVGEDLVVSVDDIGPAEALANSDEEEHFTDDVEDEGDSD